MKNINKAIIIPLLSAIAMFIKSVWGYELTDETLNSIADGILLLTMLIGIIASPKKKEGQRNEFVDPDAAE